MYCVANRAGRASYFQSRYVVLHGCDGRSGLAVTASPATRDVRCVFRARLNGVGLMRSVSTGSVTFCNSTPDCRDEETYRLLNAFFQIQSSTVRAQVTNIISAVLDDEDWASEILELTERALIVPDGDVNGQIHLKPS